MAKLYHGSNKGNLKVIVPNRSGYVFSSPQLAFVLIFSSRERNSLVARWGMNKENIPYFCERVENIFDTLYKGKSAYIYVLDSKNFFQNDRTWKYEFISDKEEDVLEEIYVKDVKEYLLQMEKEGKFQLIKYKDRKKYFPEIDQEAVKIVISIAKKYGKERAIKDCKKWKPDILDIVKKELREMV